MSEWLLRSIGFSEELATGVQRVQWAWARPELLLLGLALLIPAAWLIVRRHRLSLAHIGVGPRAMLSACRVGVLLLLVIVLGGPYLIIAQELERKPVLAVVVDESASMDLPAGPHDTDRLRRLAEAAGRGGAMDDADDAVLAEVDGYDRLTLLKEILGAAEAETLPRLAERFDLAWYGVARNVRELPGYAAAAADLDPFDRSATSLGSAIARAVDDAGGREMAGVLLLTDGRSNLGPEPSQIARRLAADDDDARAPIWSVPVGSDQPAPDLMVVDAIAPSRVGQGDAVSVLTTIASHGFQDEEVTLRLRDDDQLLDERQVRITSSGRQQLELDFEADRTGHRMLTVEIGPHADERVVENNQRVLSIEVDDEQIDLLYLEGAPRWDFRFLDHAFRRDGGISVRFVMEQQLRVDGVSAADLPAAAGLSDDPEDFEAYDVVMLGDVSRDLLTDAVIDALVEAVDNHGVGLLVQAGTEHMPHAFIDTPLAELLPMRFAAANASADAPGLHAEAFAPFRMAVSAAGAMHTAFTIHGSAARNREMWSQMPVFYWAAEATEARPGASVLAEVTTAAMRRPLIATQLVGRGRGMFIGTDSTFRWRRNVGDHLFYSFWGQSVRHVARDERRTGDRSWVEAQPRQVEPGSPVTIELFAVDDDGEPRTDTTLPMTLRDGEGEPRTIELSQSPQQPGHYRATWQAREPGMFELGFTDFDGAELTAGVHVADAGREMLNPTVDRDTMINLADLTRGGVVELEDLHTLPDRLRGEPTLVERSHERPVWDNWLLLVLLVGLYCADVATRRILGLN